MRNIVSSTTCHNLRCHNVSVKQVTNARSHNVSGKHVTQIHDVNKIIQSVKYQMTLYLHKSEATLKVQQTRHLHVQTSNVSDILP